jgi:hypothetical protein
MLVRQRGAVTMDDAVQFISEKELSKVELDHDELSTVMDALVYDGSVELVSMREKIWW